MFTFWSIFMMTHSLSKWNEHMWLEKRNFLIKKTWSFLSGWYSQAVWLNNSKGQGTSFQMAPHTLISLKCHRMWLCARGFNVTKYFACFSHHAILIIIPDFTFNCTSRKQNTSLNKNTESLCFKALVNCARGRTWWLRRDKVLWHLRPSDLHSALVWRIQMCWTSRSFHVEARNPLKWGNELL